MSFIYKPNTRKGPVFLSKTESSPPTITLPSGQVITAVTADRAGGSYKGHEGYQWVFPKDVLGQEGAVLSFAGQQQKLGNTNMSYRGDSIGSLSESNKGAMSDMTSGTGGSFAPVPFGENAFGPANLMGMFPSPFLTNYNPITAAPYKFTDVKKFAKEYGQFNREELAKNFAQSKGFAVDTLDTELQSLSAYIPAAAALKRQETSVDNQFNQAQRTQQIDTALPGVRDQMVSQGQRAETYAQGKIPDSIENRAFEVGVRSQAADRSAAGGFGAQSSVARKASDLMSAAERVNLSKYGDQLLGQNVQSRYAQEMAPTEYSNAGSQVNVNPPVSYSQLQQSNFGQINQSTILPTGQALQSQVQQNQFVTGLEQQTRQFNASNTLQNDQFNAGNQNSFALQKFGYAASLAGAYAGAAQTNTNTNIALDQQKQAQENFDKYLEMSRTIGTINAVSGGIGSIISGIGSLLSGGGGGLGDFKLPDFDFGILDSVGSGADVSSDSDFELPDFSSSTGDLFGDDFGLADLGLDDLGGLFKTAAGIKESAETNINISSDTGTGTVTGTGVTPKKAAMVAKNLEGTSKGVLATAGIHDQPVIDTFKVGVDNKGQDVYSSIPLAKSKDNTSGAKLVDGLTKIVDPLNVLEGSDRANLSRLSSDVSDTSNLMELNTAVAAKDKSAFVKKALAVTMQPSIEEIKTKAKSGENQRETIQNTASAYTATKLFENWDHMSEAQKSIGLASLGVHGYKTAKGRTLAETQVVKPMVDATGKVSTPGLTVSDSLDLMSKGYNPYSVVQNWTELNTIQKVAGVPGGTPESVAALAKSLNLEGHGPTGAAVPNITADTIQKMGGVPAPQYGVGALQVPASAKIPNGYRVTGKTTDGKQIIAPTANMQSAFVSATGELQTTAGAASVYANWGQATSRDNGSLGGSQMAAGLAQMNQTNPYLLGSTIAANSLSQSRAAQQGDTSESAEAKRFTKKASGEDTAAAIRRKGENMVASSVTGGLSDVAIGVDKQFFDGKGNKIRNSLEVLNPMTAVMDKGFGKVLDLFGGFGGGKDKGHAKRDAVRDHFQDTGFMGKDNSLTLADGTKVNLREDGQDGTHKVTNPDQLYSEQKDLKKLYAYDVDYTNDLDFAAHMAGGTLTRLVTGSAGGPIEQLGNQVGNASLKNVGYNQAMTEDNYNKVMKNQRAFYAQAGIKSKQDALQLANQAFSEKRIDAIQHATAVQSANMVFDDNSYGMAKRLMDGRRSGVAAAPKVPVRPVDNTSGQRNLPEMTVGSPPNLTSLFKDKGKIGNAKIPFDPKNPPIKYTTKQRWERNADGSLAVARSA